MLLRVFLLLLVSGLSGCFVSDRDVEYRNIDNYCVDIESEQDEYYIRKPNMINGDVEEEIKLEPLESLIQLPKDVISN